MSKGQIVFHGASEEVYADEEVRKKVGYLQRLGFYGSNLTHHCLATL